MGFRQLNSTQVEAAKSAATTLGAELAKAKLGLVVYFSDEASLEPHVVEGYVGALAKAAPLGAIRVRYAESQSGQVKFAEQTIYPDLFDRRLFPGQDWEAPFYRSLAEEDGVDGVLLVAGGPSTLVAGQIAVGRHLPVLAVEAFGGSAAKIWNHLAQVSLNQNYSVVGRLAPLRISSNSLTKSVLRPLRDVRRLAGRKSATLRSRRSDTRPFSPLERSWRC